jgi:hypothetical protein
MLKRVFGDFPKIFHGPRPTNFTAVTQSSARSKISNEKWAENLVRDPPTLPLSDPYSLVPNPKTFQIS